MTATTWKLDDFGFDGELELADITLEDALRRREIPPKDPGSSNKLGGRMFIPGLMDALGVYATLHHMSRAMITYNLSWPAMAWIQRQVDFLPEIVELSAQCDATGNTDLLYLFNKDMFVCRNWIPYGGQSGQTTIVVREDAKNVASSLAPSLGVSSCALMQIGMVAIWSRSSTSQSSGTVDRFFRPVLARWAEAVLYTREQLKLIRGLLEQRVNQ